MTLFARRLDARVQADKAISDPGVPEGIEAAAVSAEEVGLHLLARHPVCRGVPSEPGRTSFHACSPACVKPARQKLVATFTAAVRSLP